MNEIIKEKLKLLPMKSGVYVMRNRDGQVIYVGKAKLLKNRVSQYFNNAYKQAKVQAMVNNVYDFDFFLTMNERDAFALENNLIKENQPYYNILLKDGKQYPYIKVNLKNDYPRFEVTRKILKDGAKYFGPYISGISPYSLLKIITYAFNLRTCNMAIKSNTKRECLNFFLGLCSAPCTNRITKQEYRNNVNSAIDFLNGNDKNVEKILTEKMYYNSEKENFEKALELKEMIAIIKRIKEKVISSLPTNADIDVFAYKTDGKSAAISQMVIRGGKTLGINAFSMIDASLDGAEALSSYLYQYYQKDTPVKEIVVNAEIEEKAELEKWLSEIAGTSIEVKHAIRGTKLKLLQQCEQNALAHIERNTSIEKRNYDKTIGALEILKSKLGLSTLPLRIECYDISNISGTNVVSSMVVMTNGKIDKKQYRKFKIKTVNGQNDFACMEETLKRRFERYKSGDLSFAKMPDLIVIDGGKGQLSSALKSLEELDIKTNIISLAKRIEEVFVPYESQSKIFQKGSVELNLLQTIRDEAHRFAITFHRERRGKQMLASPLDEIKGIGKVKKQNLLRTFETSEGVAKASIEELNLVSGIDISLARKIYEYFRK